MRWHPCAALQVPRVRLLAGDEQKFVILVRDPVLFAPWLVLYGCTASFVTLVNTDLRSLPLRGFM